MAQTSYEEYLANLMGNINPQGGMVTGQASAPPPMAMPDISAIQAAVQGVGNVNQGYSAPARTVLAKFRTNFEDQRRQAASDFIAQELGVAPGMLSTSGDSAGGGRNYYVEREAQLRAANLPEDEVQAIVRAEQERNNQKFTDTLTSLSKFGITGIISSLFGGSTQSLPTEVVSALEAQARAQAAADEAAAYQGSSGGSDYSSYEGAGMSQTQASLSSDNTGGFYG